MKNTMKNLFGYSLQVYVGGAPTGGPSGAPAAAPATPEAKANAERLKFAKEAMKAVHKKNEESEKLIKSKLGDTPDGKFESDKSRSKALQRISGYVVDASMLLDEDNVKTGKDSLAQLNFAKEKSINEMNRLTREYIEFVENKKKYKASADKAFDKVVKEEMDKIPAAKRAAMPKAIVNKLVASIKKGRMESVDTAMKAMTPDTIMVELAKLKTGESRTEMNYGFIIAQVIEDATKGRIPADASEFNKYLKGLEKGDNSLALDIMDARKEELIEEHNKQVDAFVAEGGKAYDLNYFEGEMLGMFGNTYDLKEMLKKYDDTTFTDDATLTMDVARMERENMILNRAADWRIDFKLKVAEKKKAETALNAKFSSNPAEFQRVMNANSNKLYALYLKTYGPVFAGKPGLAKLAALLEAVPGESDVKKFGMAKLQAIMSAEIAFMNRLSGATTPAPAPRPAPPAPPAAPEAPRPAPPRPGTTPAPSPGTTPPPAPGAPPAAPPAAPTAGPSAVPKYKIKPKVRVHDKGIDITVGGKELKPAQRAALKAHIEKTMNSKLQVFFQYAQTTPGGANAKDVIAKVIHDTSGQWKQSNPKFKLAVLTPTVKFDAVPKPKAQAIGYASFEGNFQRNKDHYAKQRAMYLGTGGKKFQLIGKPETKVIGVGANGKPKEIKSQAEANASWNHLLTAFKKQMKAPKATIAQLKELRSKYDNGNIKVDTLAKMGLPKTLAAKKGVVDFYDRYFGIWRKAEVKLVKDAKFAIKAKIDPTVSVA